MDSGDIRSKSVNRLVARLILNVDRMRTSPRCVDTFDENDYNWCKKMIIPYIKVGDTRGLKPVIKFLLSHDVKGIQ